MKKLNRKGFTLIELLAIIVILAIIMVVTIPTVLGSLGDARRNTFQNSVNSVAEWIEKQYTLALYADPMVSTAFTTVCTGGTSGNGYCATTAVNKTSLSTNETTLLNAAGVKASNYSGLYIKMDADTGRACVKLTVPTGSGSSDFKSVTSGTGVTVAGTGTSATSTMQSSGC